MLRVIIAAALVAALPAVSPAQSARPPAFVSALRSASPAQQQQVGICLREQAPKCIQPNCGPGPVDQVTQCLQPYGACLAAAKRTCAQAVMGPAAARAR